MSSDSLDGILGKTETSPIGQPLESVSMPFQNIQKYASSPDANPGTPLKVSHFDYRPSSTAATPHPVSALPSPSPAFVVYAPPALQVPQPSLAISASELLHLSELVHTSGADKQRIFAQLLAAAGRWISAERVTLFIAPTNRISDNSRSSDVVDPVFYHQPKNSSDPILQASGITMRTGITGFVLKSGQPLSLEFTADSPISDDWRFAIDNDSRFVNATSPFHSQKSSPSSTRSHEEPCCSLLLVPIRSASGDTLGLLEAVNATYHIHPSHAMSPHSAPSSTHPHGAHMCRGRFGNDDTVALLSIARLIATVREKDDALNAAKQRQRQVRSLMRAAELSTSLVEPQLTSETGLDSVIPNPIALSRSVDIPFRVSMSDAASAVAADAKAIKQAVERVLRVAVSLVPCASMRLFAVEEFNGAACLISRVAVGTSATSGYHVIEFDLKSQMTEGHLGRCALSGSPAIVIEPAYSSDAHTSPAEELNHRNLAFIPVRDGRGRVLAVLRAADRFSDESAFAKRNSLVDPSVGYLATAFEGVVLSTQSQSSIPASPSQHMLLPMDFNHSDIELLTAVASQSASVLQRARALETDSKQRRQTEALLRISALANNTAKPPVPDHSILPRIVDAAYMLIPSERIALFLTADSNGVLLASRPPHSSNSNNSTGSPSIPSSVQSSPKVSGRYDFTTQSENILASLSAQPLVSANSVRRKTSTLEALVPTPPTQNRNGPLSPPGLTLTSMPSFGSLLTPPAIPTISISTVTSSPNSSNRMHTRRASVSGAPSDTQRQQLQPQMSPQMGRPSRGPNNMLTRYSSLNHASLPQVPSSPMTSQGSVAGNSSAVASNELVCVVSKDVAMQGTRVPIGVGLVGHVALVGKSVVISDAANDPRFEATFDRKTGFRTRTLLTVPVMDAEGQCIAVLQALNRISDNLVGTTYVSDESISLFTEDDQVMLESVASSIGVVLRRSQLNASIATAERKSKALLKLVRVSSDVTESSSGGGGGSGGALVNSNSLPKLAPLRTPLASPTVVTSGFTISVVAPAIEEPAYSLQSSTTEVIDRIVTVALTVLSASRVTIFFVDSQHNSLMPIASQHVTFKDSSKALVALPLNKGLLGWVVTSGMWVNLTMPHQDSRFDPEVDLHSGEIVRSMLCMPVRRGSDGAIIAVIRAVDKRVTHQSDVSINRILSSTNSDEANASPLSGYPPRNPSFNTLPSVLERGEARRRKSTDSTITEEAECDEQQSLEEYEFDESRVDEPLIISFAAEDVELLETFAIEIASTVHRHVAEAILATGNKAAADSGISSMMGLFSQQSVWGASGLGRFNNSADGFAQLLGATKAFVWPSISQFKTSLAELQSFDFDVWQHSEEDLMHYTVELFQDMGLCTEFQVSMETLKNFVMAVQKGYRQKPFHNWYHGFSVFHYAYLFLRATTGLQPVSKLEVLATLVASLCHDLDHTGRTNAFEVATGSALALLHNDKSVLENHHLAFLFTTIISDPRCNIFQNCARPTWLRARALVIGGVMSTDMTVHFDRIKDLEKRGVADSAVPAPAPGPASAPAPSTADAAQPAAPTHTPPFDETKELDRQYFVDVVVHSADLSGQLFPTHISANWEDRISAEFAEQAKVEAELKLPVAPFMQNLESMKTRAKLQHGFISFVLEPWWKQVVRLFPPLKYSFNHLQTNKAHFARLMTEAEN